jgi:hypothetical protein
MTDRTKFRYVLLALALSSLGVSAPAALAAPPSNDTFAGARPVVLGDSEVLDTTEATTDSDDAQLNTNCGAPATDASVWYALEGSDTPVVVDVSQSNYSAGVLVGVGSQGDLRIVTCGPGYRGLLCVRGDDVLRPGHRRLVRRGRQRWAFEHLVQ